MSTAPQRLRPRLRPVRTAAPTETPVSLTEVKKALRVDLSDDDDDLLEYIQAATDRLDGWTGILGRCLVTQTWRFDYGDFCTMRVRLTPVQSLTVAYSDASNVSQTLATSVYDVVTDQRGTVVVLKDGQSWPTQIYDRHDAVRITAVCGYGAASAVPAMLKTIIKKLVKQFFDGTPAEVDDLVVPYKAKFL